MIPVGEAILFAVTLKRQSGGDMYAGLFGRLESAQAPSVRCPPSDERGQDWRHLGPGMSEALTQWHAAGRFPPIAVAIHRLRTHAVDSSVRAFQLALSGLLLTVQGQPSILRRGEIQLRSVSALSPSLQSLLDAGQLPQAIELTRALEDHSALRRLLLEVAVTHPAPALPAILVALDAEGTRAALAALLADEQPRLRADLQQPADHPWTARRRSEALGWMAAPLSSAPEHAAATLGTLTDAGHRAGRGRAYGLRLREALLEGVLPLR